MTKKEMIAEIDALKRRQAELEARILSLEKKVLSKKMARRPSGPPYPYMRSLIP